MDTNSIKCLKNSCVIGSTPIKATCLVAQWVEQWNDKYPVFIFVKRLKEYTQPLTKMK